jgi:hypothetical protein
MHHNQDYKQAIQDFEDLGKNSGVVGEASEEDDESQISKSKYSGSLKKIKEERSSKKND